MKEILMPNYLAKKNTAFSVKWTNGYASFIFVQYFDTAAEGNAFYAAQEAVKVSGLQRCGFASWDK